MSKFEDIQAQLERQVKSLEEERQKNAENFEKERNQLVAFAAMERAKQLAEYEKKVEEHAKRVSEREASEKEKYRVSLAEKMAFEQKETILAENLRKQQEKLAWLENQISNAEFAEEQHRKLLDDQRQMIMHPVEQPKDGSKPSESARGTSGDTPKNELMSDHLKSILRQANRT